MGIEPTIFRFEVGRLIHWATRPYQIILFDLRNSTFLTFEQSNNVTYPTRKLAFSTPNIIPSDTFKKIVSRKDVKREL